MAFFSWVFGDSDIHHMYNRIRAQYGLNRFEDLPAEHFEEVVLMVENTKKINKKLLDILTECRNEYIKNHIDAGAPWTADLKRKWRKKINTALSEKPNWLEIQRRITDD